MYEILIIHVQYFHTPYFMYNSHQLIQDTLYPRI